MEILSLPNELMLYGIMKFVCISDLCKMILVNKYFYQMLKDILAGNHHDGILLNRIDNTLHTKMAEYNIKYSDIITSAVQDRVFDQLIKLVDIPAEKQIDYMDIIFNYAVACKKYIQKDLPVQSQRLIIQTDVFDYSIKVNPMKDFQIFQLSFYIIQNHLQGRALEVMKVSLLTQMTKYFEKHFMASISSICAETTFKVLSGLYKKNLQYYNHVFIDALSTIKIDLLDVDLYNIYYIFTASIMLNRYKFIMSTSMSNDIIDTMYDKIYTTSMYQKNSTIELQLATIAMFINLANHERTPATVYIAMSMFAYVNNIIKEKIISLHLLNNSKSFLQAMQDRAIYIMQTLEMSDKYDERTVDTSVSILEDTIELLKEYL